MARKIIPEKVAETKKKIISAALDLIIDDGFSKLTLSNVANKIEMTKAAIYWYYKSKEELLNAMASSLRTAFIDSAKLLALQPISPKYKIKSLIMSLENNDTHTKCFLLIKVFLELNSADNKIKKIIQEGYWEYIKIIEDIICEAIEVGEFQSTISKTTLARLFVAVLDGCIIQDEILGKNKIDCKELENFFMSFFIVKEES